MQAFPRSELVKFGTKLNGSGFDPGAVKVEEDTDALGGRGIRLMRALMDQVDLHYDGRGMVACLYKKLPRQAA